MAKNPPANAGDIRDTSVSVDREGALEEGIAAHSSVLACRIPWTQEPGELRSMRSQRIRHDDGPFLSAVLEAQQTVSSIVFSLLTLLTWWMFPSRQCPVERALFPCCLSCSAGLLTSHGSLFFLHFRVRGLCLMLSSI